MKKPLLAYLLIFISAIMLTGCMGENEEFIQGTWEYNSQHLAEVAGEQHLTVVWFFSNGTFSFQSCCFNADLEYAGRYRINNEEDNIINLELYNIRGTTFSAIPDIRIKIDHANDELNIQGGGPFRRLGPE